MDLVRLVQGKVLSVVEAVANFLESGTDYLSFEKQLKSCLLYTSRCV